MRKFFFSPRGELESLGVRAWTSQKKKAKAKTRKCAIGWRKGVNERIGNYEIDENG